MSWTLSSTRISPNVHVQLEQQASSTAFAFFRTHSSRPAVRMFKRASTKPDDVRVRRRRRSRSVSRAQRARLGDHLAVGRRDVELGPIGLGGGLEDHGRATVLEVAVAVSLGRARDADGAAAVGHAVGEGVDVGRLVCAGEAALVALAVRGDVLRVLGAQPADGLQSEEGGVGASRKSMGNHAQW
eukprot:6211947-Pleurochrysis_carterae.AAC.8